MKPTPARELAQSDPKELEAIQAAIRAGKPTYWLQSTSGTTLDVVVDQGVALKLWESMADRSGLGYRGINLFVRHGQNLYRYNPPRTVH
jgi:hypothetical protein